MIDKFEYSFTEDGRKQTFTVKEKRIVTYNPSLAKKQKKEILKEVEKAKTKLSIKAASREEFGDCIKYLSFESKDKEGNKIKINPSLSINKINEDLSYAGYNLPFTVNHIKPSAFSKISIK